MRRQRDSQDKTGALSGLGYHRQCSSDFTRTFWHVPQAITISELFRIESPTVILQRESQSAVREFENRFDALCLGVACNIDDSLFEDEKYLPAQIG